MFDSIVAMLYTSVVTMNTVDKLILKYEVY